MYKAINKTCPHCQQPFQARRKNQLYCTEECRIDANNAVAKERYASFRQEAPQVEVLQQQVEKIKAQLAAQIVVIKVVKPTEDTLTYAGHRYKSGKRLDRTGVGVRLDKGVALWMPGNTIIYRTESNVKEIYYEYVLDQ